MMEDQPGIRDAAGRGGPTVTAGRQALQARGAHRTVASGPPGPSRSAAACVELPPPYPVRAGRLGLHRGSSWRVGRPGRVTRKAEPVTRLAGPADDPEPKAPRSNPAPRSSSPMATRRRARRRASVRPRIFVCVPSSTYFCQLDITGQGIYIHCRQPPEF